jgi:hypothetical protein
MACVMDFSDVYAAERVSDSDLIPDIAGHMLLMTHQHREVNNSFVNSHYVKSPVASPGFIRFESGQLDPCTRESS